MNWKFFATAASAAMLLAATVRAEDDSAPSTQAAPSKPQVLILRATAPAAGEAQDVMTERGEYWLGVFVTRPSAAMQAQLKLPKDQGLIVEAVQPNSPAAKAGIKSYDLLLKANEKPLADMSDLLKMINEVKEGKLTFDLLRGGKHETVVAQLAKRPADEKAGPLTAEAQAWIEKFNPNMTPGQPLQFHIVGPGQILPPGEAKDLPKTMSAKVDVTMNIEATLDDGSKVEITRKGGDPAKVVVTHDKDRWEGTSNDLSKIPEKIRPQVERLVKPMAENMRFFASPVDPAAMQGNVMYFGKATAGAAVPAGKMLFLNGGPMMPPAGMPSTIAIAGPGVEKQLGEMQKQIDELRKQLDELKAARKKSE